MNIQKVKIAGANGGTVEAGYFQTSVTAILQLGNLELESGKQYTLHGYAKASTVSTMTCCSKNTTIGTGWTEFAFLITADSKMIQLAFTPATWWIYNWKLEVGDIITPWTPSPVDAKEDVKESTSEWKQTAEQIKSSVSKVSSDLSEAQSSWKQEADSITSSVSKVSSDLSEAQSSWKQSASELTTEISKKTDSETVKTIITANADSIRTKTGTIVWEAENSSMEEDGTFTCKDGNFTGDVNAKSITLGDGKQCKLLWGEAVPTYAWGGMASLGYYGGAGGAIHSLDIDAGGIALGSGMLGSDGSTIVENSEALMGVQGTGTGFVTAPNGFYVNGKLFDDYFPKQADSGYLHKDGYVCHLHCWGVAASSVVDTIPEKFRPKSQAVTVTGWCRNTNGQMYYPCVAMINTSGQWQVYAMTAFGGSAYVIYAPGGGDGRYSFELFLTGSWVTAYNGA